MSWFKRHVTAEDKTTLSRADLRAACEVVSKQIWVLQNPIRLSPDNRALIAELTRELRELEELLGDEAQDLYAPGGEKGPGDVPS